MAGPVILAIKFTRQDGLVADVVAESGKSIVLGRDLGCDFRLDGRKVSRRHLRIDNRADGAVVLSDAGSHNGTFVNGERISEVWLAEGDRVQAGEWEGTVELRARRGLPTPSAPPQAPRIMQGSSSSTSSPAVTHPGRPAGGDAVGGPRATIFDGVTDPSAHPAEGARASARESEVSGRAPRSTPGLMRGAAIPEWNWEESAPATEALRAARVEDNPIVRRFTESQVNLDFRGLTELSQQIADAPAGLRPSQPQAIDSIALRLVFKVTEALANAESMDQFLSEMCDSLQGAARAKAVMVLIPDGDELVPRAVKLRRPDEKVQISRTVIDTAIKDKAALTTEDASADERFSRGDSVLRFDLKAVLCAPLMKGNDVVGALYLTRDLPFSNTERDLVAALAQLIAMGLERSRLREEYAAAERTKRSLERFHAPDVVRRLMMESSASVNAGLFLEPLTATVLFCDLSGFTQWCESHDAELVGRILNIYLGTMTEIVFAHGGTVDKFIGDAIMCIFGAPFMAPDDPLRAVRAAIDMRASFRRLTDTGRPAAAAKGLDIHIGINTGKVVAGTVGSAQRMEYTALGDTVNIAARLEGAAKKGQILLGPTTAALVRDQIYVSSLGRVALKGKTEAIEVFEVPDE